MPTAAFKEIKLNANAFKDIMEIHSSAADLNVSLTATAQVILRASIKNVAIHVQASVASKLCAQ